MGLVAVIFARMGPYHAARMVGAAQVLGSEGCVALEMAGRTREYAWNAVSTSSFQRRTLFPDAEYEAIPRSERATAVVAALDELQPSVVAINGWSAREARAALRWCRQRQRVAIVMSESQHSDAHRSWPVELLKRAIVREFDAALVGGRTHAAYLEALGMSADRIAFGYDVVDNDHFARGAVVARADADGWRRRLSLPFRYFLSSARFIEKKNLTFLVDAYALFARQAGADGPHLVLLGDGPERSRIEARIEEAGLHDRVHLPGFKQYDELPYYYGLAEAFVLPSLVEPWGLVVNEAMAAGLPVLVSRACGAAEVVEEGVNGYRFSPNDPGVVSALLGRMGADASLRRALGVGSGRKSVAFRPERFGAGLREAADRGSLECSTRVQARLPNPVLWT